MPCLGAAVDNREKCSICISKQLDRSCSNVPYPYTSNAHQTQFGRLLHKVLMEQNSTYATTRTDISESSVT